MSFRQFPATDAEGTAYVVIEFRDEQNPETAADPHVRYELSDGQRLVRDGRNFHVEGGGLTVTV